LPLDLPQQFAGRWQLKRRIMDRRLMQAGAMTGHVSIQPCKDGSLHWQEHGLLRFGGHEGEASRTYRLRQAVDGGLAFDFEDERPFFAVPTGEKRWRFSHLCAPDRYEGRWFLKHADELWLSWWITGPRKDYRMISRYSRANSADSKASKQSLDKVSSTLFIAPQHQLLREYPA
jgi:hypothetical protein